MKLHGWTQVGLYCFGLRIQGCKGSWAGTRAVLIRTTVLPISSRGTMGL